MAMSLRPRLRRPDRLRRQHERADGEGAQGGRGLPGPSLVIAYSPCIAHGYDLKPTASSSRSPGWSIRVIWPLYRFDPRRRSLEEEPPLKLDSGPRSKISIKEFMRRSRPGSGWSRSLDPERFKRLSNMAEKQRHGGAAGTPSTSSSRRSPFPRSRRSGRRLETELRPRSSS